MLPKTSDLRTTIACHDAESRLKSNTDILVVLSYLYTLPPCRPVEQVFIGPCCRLVNLGVSVKLHSVYSPLVRRGQSKGMSEGHESMYLRLPVELLEPTATSYSPGLKFNVI